MRHPLTITTFILLALAGAMHLRSRSAAEHRVGSQHGGTEVPVRTVHASGTQLSIPDRWIPASAPSGVHVWRSADRGANVTAAMSPASTEPLGQVLAGAAAELAASLSDGRVIAVNAQRNAGMFEVRGVLRGSSQHVRITQTWKRVSSPTTWMVLSWVDTPAQTVSAALRLQGLRSRQES